MKMIINCRVIHTLIQSILTAVANLLKATYAQEDREATFAKIKDAEYSDENKPAFRNGENRQTGIQDTALAA